MQEDYITLLFSLSNPVYFKLGDYVDNELSLIHILWEISFSFLQMLMADAITSVYLTDEEKKEARISNDRTFVNADVYKRQVW